MDELEDYPEGQLSIGNPNICVRRLAPDGVGFIVQWYKWRSDNLLEPLGTSEYSID